MIIKDLQKNIDDWVQLNEDDICYQIALDIILNNGTKLNTLELKLVVSKHSMGLCNDVEEYEQHIIDVINEYHTLTDSYNLLDPVPYLPYVSLK